MNDNPFTITFTTAELLCAATALGLAAAPVQMNPPLTGAALQNEIYRGYELLQQRGLVQVLGTARWQIDNMLAILTHWLVSADSTLQLDVWENDGNQRQARLLFWRDEALWQQSESDTHYLTLFPTGDGWVKHSVAWLGPFPETPGELVLTIPSVELATFLPKLSQNPSDWGPVLQRVGLPPEIVSQTVDKLATLMEAAILTWQCEANGEQKAMQQAVILRTPTEVWGGIVGASEALVMLRPFTTPDLIQLLCSEMI
jgi:hypothetical protein